MHCPYCGAKNRSENHYCVDCGSELRGASGDPADRPSVGERITRLIGTTRRARLVSIATVAALVVAAAAFLALKPSEGTLPENGFARAMDRACVTKKRTIAALEQETIQQRSPNLKAFSGALVLIVEEWRSTLRESPVPLSHAGPLEALDEALLEVLIKAGALARVARDGSPAQVATEARRVDVASIGVDRAIDDLGLDRCSDVDVAPVVMDRP